jgi:hypothetical protein
MNTTIWLALFFIKINLDHEVDDKLQGIVLKALQVSHKRIPYIKERSRK